MNLQGYEHLLDDRFVRALVMSRPVPMRLVDDLLAVREETGLTETEDVHMALLASGLTKEEAAGRLGRSPNTVHELRKRAFAKLEAKNAPHAVTLWLARASGSAA